MFFKISLNIEEDRIKMDDRGIFPKFKIRNADYYEMFDWLLNYKRSVYLLTSVNTFSIQSIVTQIMFLSEKDNDAPIKLFINSNGGNVTDALTLYDYVQLVPNKIWTICTGMAASAASFILITCGNKGCRTAYKNATVMLHQPYMVTGEGERLRETDLKIVQARMSGTRELLANLYSEHCNLSKQEVNNLLQEDTFVTADKSLENGFIDQILEKKS